MKHQADLRALPVKWIFDPSFRYTPSYATDLRKTFERIRNGAAGKTLGAPGITPFRR